MFFSGSLHDMFCWAMSLLSFVLFCMVSSGIYCINDVVDVDADRVHPVKCRRPVAAGEVSSRSAVLMGSALMVLALLFGVLLSGVSGLVVMAIYVVLNIAYSLHLKRYALIDVFVVAFCFVLRLVMGGVACGIELSPWIVCMTFLLALFLAFAKRRDDVVAMQAGGEVKRRSVASYNLPFMDQTLGIIAAVTLVCYVIYTVQPEVEMRLGSDYVYVTSLFVLGGILRYLQLTIVEHRSGSPTSVVCHDLFIQVCLACWLVSFIFIIYL
jgi:4-hydroxybenzoate polyprenyltransferase